VVTTPGPARLPAARPARLHPARVEARATRSSVLREAMRPHVVAAGALVVAIVVAAGVWGRQALRREVEHQLEGTLAAVLATSIDGLTKFLVGCERLGRVVAQSPDVRVAAARVVDARGGDGAAAAVLARALEPYLAAGHVVGFVLTDSEGTVLVQGGGLAKVGERPDTRVFPRAAAVAAGARAGLPHRDPDGRVRVTVAVPLREAPGFLGLAFDHRGFTASLVAARAGTTGETYAFDRQGLMLSTSRFPAHLRAAGLIGPDEDESALRVELRDPGGDLSAGYRSPVRRRDQPLTAAVAGAVAAAGELGATMLEPYRDYRGVPVVGAWRWLPERELGVATEMDAAQAYQPLRALERVFGTLVALLAAAGAAAVAASAAAARARLRAARSEREARRVGEYVLERRLGGGAMGEVFLARHGLLRRPTAIKLLRADMMSPEAIERFEREVRVTATLSHPNTVAIYDYGRAEDGAFYYAMEFLDGVDLESLVAAFGPQPEARVIHLLRQACGALGESHDAGVVHRDVKLANLYLCARGGRRDVLKVLDFGLVKAREDVQLTRASLIVGTPEYMAPELFESARNASVLTDVYALGCAAYVLLTGSRPFEGSSLAELCNAHLTRAVEPPSRRLGRGVDAALERVVVACLAKRPHERPQSMREVVMLLDRSPLARAWAPDDADAFWAAHKERLEELVRRRGERTSETPA
jgi:hypothetical protein